MNKLRFIIKFICNKGNNKKYNWNLLFPFAGVIIGCITVALTFSIMEGMEYAIFTKLEEVSSTGKLENISLVESTELNSFLYNCDIKFQKGIEDQVIVMNGADFRLVTIHGIEDFQAFKNNVFKGDMVEYESNSMMSGIYIGSSLAVKLDISLGDTIRLVHPENINIFTGLPNQKQMIVSGIFELKIIDYDQQHIFSQYYSVSNFIPNKKNHLLLDAVLTNDQHNMIKESFPLIDYKYWEDKHQSFISAMKLEKYTYSIIGFLIVCIAGFTLMSMMSLSVMQKVPQIGILRSIGMDSYTIGYVFIIQAIVTSILSSIIGILLSIYLIYLDSNYNLIKIMFPEDLYFDFPLILKPQYIVLIFIISLILMFISGLYPSIKAARLDPVESINIRR